MNGGTVCAPVRRILKFAEAMQTRMNSVSSNDPFISHYTLDRMGRRVLVGLSFDETSEFERLDVSIPHARKPFSASAIVPLEPSEIRWLELYRKHRAAFEAMQNKRV
jgi:hypothetical protein